MAFRQWSRRKWILSIVAIIVGLPLLAVGMLVLYIFAWFNAGRLYSGDGEYRTGQGAATFQVTFHAIDPSKRGRSVFNFTRLGPSLNYTVGLTLVDRNRKSIAFDNAGPSDRAKNFLPDVVVRIQLVNERGETVFQHVRPLSEWDWLRHMARIDEQIVEVPIGGGSVQIQRVGVGPDEGWGTDFTPRWFGRYTLTIEVLEPAKESSYLLIPVIEGYTALP
jgi:hypothetical protein